MTLYITTRVSAAEAKAAAAVEAIGRELRLLIDKNAEVDAGARHKIANGAAQADAELRRDVEQVKRETVKREEMSAMEARIMTSVTKLDSKMDTMADKLSQVVALGERMRGLDDKVERLVARLDTNREGAWAH